MQFHDLAAQYQALKKDIDAKWGSFKVKTRSRGENVDNPPPGENNDDGTDKGIRDMISGWHTARFGAEPAKQ